MSEKNGPTEGSTVSVEDPEGGLNPEALMALQAPAVWADRFVISVGQDHARISFLEMGGTHTPHARAAVVMSPANALQLAEMLADLIKRATEGADGQS